MPRPSRADTPPVPPAPPAPQAISLREAGGTCSVTLKRDEALVITQAGQADVVVECVATPRGRGFRVNGTTVIYLREIDGRPMLNVFARPASSVGRVKVRKYQEAQRA